MKRYQVGDDPELDKIDRILHQAQMRGPVALDDMIDLPWNCTGCRRKGVDRQTFRHLVHGPGDYHFPKLCEVCATKEQTAKKIEIKPTPIVTDDFDIPF